MDHSIHDASDHFLLGGVNMGAAIGKLLGGILTGLGVQSNVIRTFLMGIFLAGLVIVVYNGIGSFCTDLIQWGFNKASSATSIESQFHSITVAGPLAYILYKFNFHQVIPAFFSAFTIRIGLKLIPFIKVN